MVVSGSLEREYRICLGPVVVRRFHDLRGLGFPTLRSD